MWIALLLTPLILASPAYQGTPDFLVDFLTVNFTQNSSNDYKEAYAQTALSDKTCMVCHGNPIDFNVTANQPFGNAFKTEATSLFGTASQRSQADFNTALTNILSADSDGDGTNNGDEFVQLRDPGVADAPQATPTPTPTPSDPNTGNNSDETSEDIAATGDERILQGGGCGVGATSQASRHLPWVLALPLLILWGLRRRS